jgi:hypothetical protein
VAETYEFSGACTNCRRTVVAHLTFDVKGSFDVAPPPLIGSYCCCGSPDSLGGQQAQAVPLTLRGDPA